DRCPDEVGPPPERCYCDPVYGYEGTAYGGLVEYDCEQGLPAECGGVGECGESEWRCNGPAAEWQLRTGCDGASPDGECVAVEPTETCGSAIDGFTAVTACESPSPPA
ncbi:hypothetical protein, partial [Alienimonas sp. DA493]|uniref:hypothetical protein n=1 Tax=Alienimonas sp. DA493 TaxID=3373605 RepID=UPI003754AA08